MDVYSIILLSVALAMDCFAVSITNGIVMRRFHLLTVLKMSFFFGFFQAMMPLIGWLAGRGFQHWIEAWDHWLAFGILLVLGVRMIIEGVRGGEEEIPADAPVPDLKWKRLLMLSVATSIDALATGLVFVTSPVSEFVFALCSIGIVSFLFSFGGNMIGVYAGKRLPVNMQVIGGVVLVFIGVKIIAEHLGFI